MAKGLGGIFAILSQASDSGSDRDSGLQGRRPASGPAQAEPILRPDAEALGNPVAARSWARESFARLRGAWREYQAYSAPGTGGEEVRLARRYTPGTAPWEEEVLPYPRHRADMLRSAREELHLARSEQRVQAAGPLRFDEKPRTMAGHSRYARRAHAEHALRRSDPASARAGRDLPAGPVPDTLNPASQPAVRGEPSEQTPTPGDSGPAEPPAQGEPAQAQPGGSGPAEPPAREQPPKVRPGGPAPTVRIEEGFLGLRWVRPVRDVEKLPPLPPNADVATVQKYVLHYFRDVRPETIATMDADILRGLSQSGYPETLEERRLQHWLARYDRLAQGSREAREYHDHEKHHGGFVGEIFSRAWAGLMAAFGKRREVVPGSFRKLANKTYAPGWKGIRHRAREVQKHLAGSFIRVPYALSDMFCFGYFRKNWSWFLFHGTEDYLGARAEEVLLAAHRDILGHGLSAADQFRTSKSVRPYLASQGWSLKTAVGFGIVTGRALGQFLWRRGLLAVFSAVAMGLVAPWALHAGWMSDSLTALPLLGFALTGTAQALPAALGLIPGVGTLLSAVAAKAMEALLADLLVKHVVNTYVLSALVSFEGSFRQFLRKTLGVGFAPAPLWTSRGLQQRLEVFRPRHWRFWLSWLGATSKTFFGMMSVGAEIAGIMQYAEGLDGYVNPAYQAVVPVAVRAHLGDDFKVFHAVGAAVERPATWREGDVEHQNLIPFGGAINWGNLLLYKLQDAVGFNITDWVFHQVHPSVARLYGRPELADATQDLRSSLAGESVAAAIFQGGVAAAASIARSRGAGGGPPDGSSPLGSAAQAAGAAVASGLSRDAGDIERDLAEAREKLGALQKELLGGRLEQEALEKARRPITPEEEAAYREALKARLTSGAENEIESKLAQIHDIKNPKSDGAARLAQLLKIQEEFKELLPPPGQNPGRQEAFAQMTADLKSVQAAIERVLAGKDSGGGPALGGAGAFDPKTRARIEGLLSKIEGLKSRAQESLAKRDSDGKTLATAQQAWNKERWGRNDGKLMMEFQGMKARAKAVHDYLYAISTLRSALGEILRAQELNDRHIEGLQSHRETAVQDRARAQANQDRTEEWTKKAKGDVQEDETQKADLLTSHNQAAAAVTRIESIRTGWNEFLGTLDSQDGTRDSNGQPEPGSALAEYQRLKALLPRLVEWRTHGKPGDPDYANLDQYNAQLKETQDLVKKIDEGIEKLSHPPNVPDEYIGLLIIKIPGVPDPPSDKISGKSVDWFIQSLLNPRRDHWREKIRDHQDRLDDINRRLVRGFKSSDPAKDKQFEEDDFGDSHPVLLEDWLALSRKNQDEAKARLRDILAGSGGVPGFNQLVEEVNQASTGGEKLPLLPDNDIDSLIDVLKTYSAKLRKVSFPNDDSDAVFQAKMRMLLIVELLPFAARQATLWAKADAEVEAIHDAKNIFLPRVKAALEVVLEAERGVLADVDLDEAYLKGARSEADRNALFARKSNLLQMLRPAAETGLRLFDDPETGLIKFQKKQIESVDPKGDKYARLFDAQIDLRASVRDGFDKDLPRALISNGAPAGDVQAELAGIDTKERHYRESLDGYDENGKHHKGILELKQEVEDRITKNLNKTEELYGETQPFGLYDKIEKYSAEKTQRAGEFNAAVGESNKILAEIEQLTGGKFNLLRPEFQLPTNIEGSGKDSKDALERLKNAETLQNLGDLLTQIGNEYKEKAGDPSLGSKDEGIPASGDQGRVELTDDAKVAVLALQVGRRLVESSRQASGKTSAALALARYLYSDAVVESSQEWINTRIPKVKKILGWGEAALNRAIDDLNRDREYINGSNEPGDRVLQRKIDIFSELRDLTKAAADFYDLKISWDKEAVNDTIPKISEYYGAMDEIYDSSVEVIDKELDLALRMRDSLKKAYDGFEAQKRKLQRWHDQLNSPYESVNKQTIQALEAIQDQTSAVLRENLKYRDALAQYKLSDDDLGAVVGSIEEKQNELQKVLEGIDPWSLPPDLAGKIEKALPHAGTWLFGGTSDMDRAHALVVPKAGLRHFVDRLLSSLRNQFPLSRLEGMRSQILADPSRLAELMASSQFIDLGDGADGFYLVYRNQFSVPGGVATSRYTGLGNIARFGNTNVNVVGYQIMNPANDESAPSGVRAIGAHLETQGKGYVNNLNIDLERFLSDYPPDIKVLSTVRGNRISVVDDFAMMLFGDRLYMGVIAFADHPLNSARDQLSMVGGSFKTSVRLNEVLRLSAKEQEMFISDPRFFLQRLNLDFTGFDEALNRDFIISGEGQNSRYSRRQAELNLDVAKFLHSDEAFNLDLFFARQRGTFDIEQKSVGLSVLKGFSLRDAQGKPWAVVSNRATGELGQKFDTFQDQVTVNLPGPGIVFNAQGRIVADQNTYYIGATKQIGNRTQVELGYGSRHPGEQRRLILGTNTSFTATELWRLVARRAAKEMQGGAALEDFNKDLENFFKNEAPDSRSVADLKEVFFHDLGSRLLTQNAGELSKQIADLDRAGALFSNVRTRGQIGFVTRPVGQEVPERALGGGFATGTATDVTLSKIPKELRDKKVTELVETGLRLQLRLVDDAKALMSVLAEIERVQAEMRMARDQALGAPPGVLQREGEARLAAAEARLAQARIRYNMLTGRSPNEALPAPLENLSAASLDGLLQEVRAALGSPDRLTRVLHQLDEQDIRAAVGRGRRSLVNFIPFIERMTVSVGAQVQDHLANQILGASATGRIVLRDPSSKHAGRAVVLEDAATIRHIRQLYREVALTAHREAAREKAWGAASEDLKPEARRSARHLAWAIAGRRNGHLSEQDLRDAYVQWRWAVGSLVSAESNRALSRMWASMDQTLVGRADFTDNSARGSSSSRAPENIFRGQLSSDVVSEGAVP
ncbi:MAG: hypothetical protein HY551_03730, partial [Elusimicrobia bacterium]|nr:hypothetical protein [Elusimicrobiota bacterium]